MNNHSLPHSFSDLIRQSELPVLADFWADWCMPCKTMAPSIHRLAEEMKGRLVVVKINIDQKPEIASLYQIQSVPTLMIFHRGTILARQSGSLPFEQIKQMVIPFLSAQ